ncbi:MAG: hypothetical protein AUH92_01550 [Acidobacteria bacterium 13_1_40CM_4_69_4]|nr:MAG: hypothetical protein AUH92_01550 [Acidobacteria bacterium 13_1_40CM_4_69_4]
MAAEPGRHAVRALALATVVLSAGTAGPLAPATAAEADWSLRLAFDERYDDNIIQLSPRDLDRLQNPTPSQQARNIAANRFSIDTPDDFVSIPRLSTGLRATWLRNLPTSFSLDGILYRYRDNPIKDYESYHLAVLQPVHRGGHATTVRLYYSLIPSFYSRNMVSDIAVEEGVVPLTSPVRRLEARYKKSIRQIQVGQAILPDRLWLEGAAGNEERNFDHFFNERDSEMPYYAVGPIWTPLAGGRPRLAASFRREDLHARGSRGDPFIHDDISSRRDVVTAEARVRWGPRGRRKSISAEYEDERRGYVTTDVNDAFHFDRTDRRRYATLTFRADLKGAWFLAAAGEHDSNRSHFAAPGLASDPSDATDFDENLYTVTLGYAFGAGEKERMVP